MIVHVTWDVLETRRKISILSLLLVPTWVFSQACGGPNRVSVYSSTGNVTVLPVPTPLQTGLPANWQYKGCLRFVLFPLENYFLSVTCLASLQMALKPFHTRLSGLLIILLLLA